MNCDVLTRETPEFGIRNSVQEEKVHKMVGTEQLKYQTRQVKRG